MKVHRALLVSLRDMIEKPVEALCVKGFLSPFQAHRTVIFYVQDVYEVPLGFSLY